MSKDLGDELSPQGLASIQAVDGYLAETIQAGRPIEALFATRRLGEIASDRAEEAARAATEGPWSWTDVGTALGVSKQAAHEKLHARVQGKLDQARSKLDRAEQAAHAKIERRANRGRKKLDRVPPVSPKVEAARQRIDKWEDSRHEKLSGHVEKARETIAQAEQTAHDKLDGKELGP